MEAAGSDEASLAQLERAEFALTERRFVIARSLGALARRSSEISQPSGYPARAVGLLDLNT